LAFCVARSVVAQQNAPDLEQMTKSGSMVGIQLPDSSLKKKGRIVVFPKGASLVREQKKVPGAGKNTELKKADVIRGAPKGDALLLFGEQFYAEVVAKSVVRIVRMLPPLLPQIADSDIELRLDQGAIRIRTSWLTTRSKWVLVTKSAITAIKGTAFQVRTVSRGGTEVIVAEGRVTVALPDTDPDIAGLVIGPGQKAVIDGQLPEAPTNITPADAPVIDALFRIPTAGLGGISTPPAFVGSDVPDVTVVNLNTVPGVRLYNPPIRGARNVVWPIYPIGIRSVDANGIERLISKDMYLEAISPDGKTVYGSKPNEGIWKMSLDGKNQQQVTKQPLGKMDLSPGGTRFVAQSGWEQVDEEQWDANTNRYKKTGKKRWQSKAGHWIVMKIDGSGLKTLMKFPGEEGKHSGIVTWRRGGKFLFGTLELDERPSKAVFFDGNASPVRRIGSEQPSKGYSTPYGDPRISPQGTWILADAGKFLRVSDGAAFNIPAGCEFVEFLPRDERFLGKMPDGNLVTGPLTNPTQTTAANATGIVRYPRDIDSNIVSVLSPNGNLLMFVNREGTLTIADARNPSVQKQIGVGLKLFSSPPGTGFFDWISDAKFKFSAISPGRDLTPPQPGRVDPSVRGIVDFGLKKPPPDAQDAFQPLELLAQLLHPDNAIGFRGASR